MNKLLFKLKYTRVKKTDFGRCIDCAANNICVNHVDYCKCNDNQQYKPRFNKYSVAQYSIWVVLTLVLSIIINLKTFWGGFFIGFASMLMAFFIVLVLERKKLL